VKRLTALVVTVVTVFAALLGSASPASAAGTPDLPHWNWLIPTGTICVEVRGSVYATQAALDLFYNTDAKTLPARSNCNGYPRTNVVKLIPKDLGLGTCARTSGNTWHQERVRGVLIHVLDDPWIEYNTNPALLQACFGTAFAARHVWTHELVHAVGLRHVCAASVVGGDTDDYGQKCSPSYSWKFDTTTAWDRAEINRRY
jgi:hypothetical protein